MAIVEGQKVKVKWNNANRKQYETLGYEFTQNGEEFEVNIKHLSKGSKSIVKATCDWCENIFTRQMQYLNKKGQMHHFCSNDCQHKFRSDETERNKPIKICVQCGNTYKTTKHEFDKSKFCTRECFSKWQSINYKGSGSSRYIERVKVKCDWCNNELERTPSHLSTRQYNFCNRECQRSWHKEVFMKTEESVKRNRETMLRNLNEGKISFTESKPQLIINELLTSKNIKYTNEKILGEFAFDVYLDDYNLLIEVNGGFWHSDNRFYDKIQYDMQLRRLISDEKKKTYLKNKYKLNVLYLWEFDIETNLQLCDLLINKLIEKKGKLKNYHSFNYTLGKSGGLSLDKQVIKPYMDWTAKELEDIVDLGARERVSRYQPDRHIICNCETCGKEHSQRKVYYIKSENHFCSNNCRKKFQKKNNVYYNCDNCNKEIEVKGYVYKELQEGIRSKIFCNKKCQGEWNSVNTRGDNNPNYNSVKKVCNHCNKEYTVPLNRKSKSKFCSEECKRAPKVNKIKFKCDYCKVDCETTPSNYKRSKNHFCGHKCADTYRSEKLREIRKCEICGKEMNVKKSSKQRFCSVECQGKWQSKTLIGKNANNYKHGECVKNT